MECRTRHEYGMTQWCQNGSHGRCQFSAGGACARGHLSPQGYLTMPGRQAVVAVVSEPRYLWRCPCPCHETGPIGQLDLFAEVVG